MIGCLFLFLYQQRKLKASFTLAGIALLCLIDMWSINKRYLNDEQFVPKSKQTEAFVKTQADEMILQDTTLNYRVLNFIASPVIRLMKTIQHTGIKVSVAIMQRSSVAIRK